MLEMEPCVLSRYVARTEPSNKETGWGDSEDSEEGLKLGFGVERRVVNAEEL